MPSEKTVPSEKTFNNVYSDESFGLKEKRIVIYGINLWINSVLVQNGTLT